MINVLLSAVLTALSMPGMLWGGLIWIALVPLFLELNRSNLVSGTLKSFLFGYIYLLLAHYWVFPVLSVNVPEVLNSFPPFVGGMTFFLMGLIMAVSFLGFGFIYSLYSKKFQDSLLLKSVFVATLYTIFEYLRGLGPLGFTGGRLSDALVDQKGLLQLSSLGGPLLLIFIVAFVNALIAARVGERRRGRPMFVVTLLLAIFVINGAVERLIPVVDFDPEYSKEIIAIQTNFPQSIKYNGSIQETLKVVEEALEEVPDGSIVVLPEATFMNDIRHNYVGKELIDICERKQLELFIGFPTFNEGTHNQIRVVSGDGFSSESYAKIKLTPFAEFLPWPRLFGVFGFLRFLDFFTPGNEYTVFTLNDQRIGTQICFDSYYPSISRGLTKNGSFILITSTNDGWFSFDSGLNYHLSKSVIRAVENRRFVLQVSNTGITALIDPYGRIIKSLPTAKEKNVDFLVSTFEYVPLAGQSFYTRHGDWLFYILLIVALIMIVFGGILF
ncbi:MULTISPECIES: apolipoprotein N-acyltransferase [unclassified Kosmotoga]|uniref:apolipoprotein N-acyltransferase n=1 Tax=unclassified Kosmotoga TaxID=2631489 RepID=UPI0007C57B7C|nr:MULTISPECIES: apolipoprotein N-acyltransferase [unclassified Kosmotoga]MDI3524387.1 apolipoprotein N-acyltransferase [Kosmotoga sp.]MDK2952696.1 apolipoprotein N-acyltransferase [Kosmotoga sp.]OAA19259.1 acyltransferase [Kosmotoga sp. DU53]